MKRLLTIILFQFMVAIINGQVINVSGSIKISKTNESIPFATISFKSLIDSIGLTANIDGLFSTSALKSGNYLISVRSTPDLALDTIIQITEKNSQINLELVWSSMDSIFIGTNSESAKRNIKNGKIYLYLPGGLAGPKRLETDSIFESKYLVRYMSYGCTRFINDNFSEYNQVTFEYLDTKFGKAWRKEARKDVIGLNQ